jgi:hypothetical protein
MQGVILKLDFEKAYDKVRWNFMIEVLRKKLSRKMGRMDEADHRGWKSRN